MSSFILLTILIILLLISETEISFPSLFTSPFVVWLLCFYEVKFPWFFIFIMLLFWDSPLLHSFASLSLLDCDSLRFAYLYSISWLEVLVTWSLSLELFSVFWQERLVARCCAVSDYRPGNITQEQQIYQFNLNPGIYMK
jgi:hypothetical protein